MGDRSFRFGVVAAPDGGPERWAATARRIPPSGGRGRQSSLLMPDGLQLLAPFPSLALAAGATTTLRVGTFVLASPLRPARSAAWEGHSLSVLTAGRFGTVEMADELQRRRDAYGVSYVSVNGAFTEQFAPVVERLAGR